MKRWAWLAGDRLALAVVPYDYVALAGRSLARHLELVVFLLDEPNSGADVPTGGKSTERTRSNGADRSLRREIRQC